VLFLYIQRYSDRFEECLSWKAKISFVLLRLLYRVKYSYFCLMSSIRQNKIEGVIQEEMALFFQRNSGEICLGAMVSVTSVRVTADLSLAKCYLSVFAGPDKVSVLENIKQHTGKIRGEVGKRLKNMRKIPELAFYIDDSLDYAAQIDALLKKK
jgi:ribosome-binding factor A